jgi:transcriptional antiterminator NusG
MSPSLRNGPAWYAVQTLSNQEAKAKTYLEKFIAIEEMGDYVYGVLMPTEVISEVKNGKRSTRVRRFYPGYIFVHMSLYDHEGKLNQKAWYFVRDAQGVINFVGGDNPVPLKKEEIDRILKQVEDSQGKEKPKVEFELGEEVKIADGPFVDLTGKVEELNPDSGKIKVSVSIFGRFTPVELEYWQVEKLQD